MVFLFTERQTFPEDEAAVEAHVQGAIAFGGEIDRAALGVTGDVDTQRCRSLLDPARAAIETH